MSDQKRAQHLTHPTGTPLTDNLNISDRRNAARSLVREVDVMKTLAYAAIVLAAIAADEHSC